MSEPRAAASVILLREGTAGAEVLLLRRHRKASFMSSAFVFPGGAAEPGDGDPRVTAARELFEEAGVLVADRAIDDETRARWRAAMAAGTPLPELLAEASAALAVDELHYFAHWITPSVEPKRFSARFYTAALPAGQEPSYDDQETVDQLWVTPDDGLARAGELKLPPPQVRSLAEMAVAARDGIAAVFALADERARHPHAVMPRFAPAGTGFALLLPWDPEYDSAGQGDGLPMPAGHPLAVGPSRFVLDGTTWRNVEPGGAPAADPPPRP